MRMFACAITFALLSPLIPASLHAAAAPPHINIALDATDAPRKIFHAQLTIPASAGTLTLYALLMTGTCATALACLFAAGAWGLFALGAWCVVCFIVFAAIDYHWRKSLPDSP